MGSESKDSWKGKRLEMLCLRVTGGGSDPTGFCAGRGGGLSKVPSNRFPLLGTLMVVGLLVTVCLLKEPPPPASLRTGFTGI